MASTLMPNERDLALAILKFRKLYPRRRRFKVDWRWGFMADDEYPEQWMVDWLDEHCSGWGWLEDEGRGLALTKAWIGFSSLQHAEKFEFAVSLLISRRQAMGRHDRWTRKARCQMAIDLDSFRTLYPKRQRMWCSWDWRIWHEGRRYQLLDDVRAWLDGNCPGWGHYPGTCHLGFPSQEHAVCFKMVWGGPS
ncbi:hypothetical protein [Methylobacterium indicum]|uniref:Uncharacterized protein n=1 Tax=Methylobacterium indicum TaxID=1775910 RepID=A0A8H8WXP4_9HYPH|nr:hypothetical protein [Methylobacterium indicum]BCM86486.1 hypothetical protein mvi_49470 [Methylobacterium indicum]